MSTRGHYTFTGTDYRPTVQIYIHHDNYAEGGAVYFWRMHHAKGKSLADKFHRATVEAEFVGGKAGDVQFSYTVNSQTGHLDVEERDINTNELRLVFSGPWWRFVNEYGEKTVDQWGEGAGFEELKEITLAYGHKQIMTATEARATIKEKEQLLARWVQNDANQWGTESANTKGLREEIALIRSQIGEGEPLPTVYRVVRTVEGKLDTKDYTRAELMGLGFNYTGEHTSPQTRAELQGQPRFSELFGPMYDGPNVIRYEDEQAYNILSI